MRARVFLLLFGVVSSLALGECALRIVGYEGQGDRVQRVYDRRYGAVPRDSWIWSFDIDPARHRAVELRGARFLIPKPAGERRILFVGDSATEGAFVAQDESFPAVFDELLSVRKLGAEERGRTQMRVINAGVWGMTTIDEYHLLEDKLLPLEPDVVVIGLFMANDLNMNLAHRALVAQHHSVWGRLTRYSALAHFTRLRLLGLRARAARTGAVGSDADPDTTLTPVELKLVDQRGLRMLSYPEGELATYIQPESQLMEHAYEVLADILRGFQRLGERHGFDVRVLLVPSPSRVLGRLAILHYPTLLSELEQSGVHVDPGAIDVDAPTRRVLSVCESLSLPCVDPTVALRRLGARAFFPTDEHPTALAHRAMAQALAVSP